MSKQLLFVIAITIQCLVLNITQTQAWEFSLSGSLMWTYETYSQQGRAGFFGPYDVDSSAVPFTYSGDTRYPSSAANLNLWNGISRAFNVQMASGTDVAVSYLQGDFWPSVKINRAIDIKGRLRIGGNAQNYGPYYGPYGGDAYQYRTWQNPGTLNNMGMYWPLLWGTAHTPWGSVSYGKRPMPFGIGLQYDGDSNLTSESISLRTNYGPLSIAFGFYPQRQAPLNTLNQWSSSSSSPPGPPRTILSGSTSFYNAYYNTGDKSGIRKQDLCASVVYSTGNLEAGLYGAYFSYHIGPEGTLQQWLPTILYMPRLTEVIHGTTYVKYSNGRLFLNAEAAWFYDTTKYDGHCPTYVEQWRYMTELGVITGPTKLGFLFAFSPGLDRRHGTYIDKQPAGFLRQPTLSNELAGITIWRQYAYLLPYIYGSGLAAVSGQETVSAPGYSASFRGATTNQGLNQEGYMLDALVLAARLDYAVASNLNLFGTFFTAQRASKSYPWGFISPQYSLSDYNGPSYTGNVMLDFSANSLAPSIPDTSLGYEFDVGLAWKLLENWKVEAIVCRWQPGKWFSYACIDKSTTWRTPTSSNNFGTNPGRTIDAIMAVRVDLTSSF